MQDPAGPSRTVRGATLSGSKNERAVSTAPQTDAADTVVPFPAARRPRTQRRAIDAAIQERIGRGLRLHYAEVLAQPVPDRLLTLLDALAETEAQP